MKSIVKLLSWTKIFYATIIALILLVIVSKPIPVASSKIFFLEPDSSLYEKYIANRQKYPAIAAMYLWAYIKRDPPDYVNNTDGFRDWVRKEIEALLTYIDVPRRQMVTVNQNIRSCGCYPCSVCKLKDAGGSENYGVIGQGVSNPPLSGTPMTPPNTVIVCVGWSYQGQCRVLPVDVYNNPDQMGLPNDSISSVLVGSAVRLTLYAHEDLRGPSVSFMADDPDLSNNSIDQQYRWNDNASSLIVEQR